MQFVGIEGRVLASHKLGPNEPSASYKMRGSELYVRARVSDATGRSAWTPAVRVVGTPINASASDRLAGPPPPG